MEVSSLCLAVEAADPAGRAVFWGALLGRPVVTDGAGLLLPGDDKQVDLRFVPGRDRTGGPQRVHLHVTSLNRADQQRTVSDALARGGRHLDVGQRPEEGHVVLADPGGDSFCVIEPGNAFLAGCGRLGELACDGSREVGLFWRDALGWSLVWDHDGETAIQSPAGGTKVAWGGPPVTAIHGRGRHRFELTTPDPGATMEQLVALGAGWLGDRDGAAEVADPDGNEFLLRAVSTGGR